MTTDNALSLAPSAAPAPVPAPILGDGQSYPEVATRAVQNVHLRHQSPFYGYIRNGMNQKIYLYPTLQDAKWWFDNHMQLEPVHDYAAVFDGNNLSGPIAGMEHYQSTAVGNWWLPVLGIPLGALGGYFYGQWRAKNPGKTFPFIGQDYPNGYMGGYTGGYGTAVGYWGPRVGPQVGGPWMDLVGAQPVAQSQQQSMALIQRAIQETSASYNEELADLQGMSAADREEARREGYSFDLSKVAYVWLLNTSQNERGPGWIISDVHRRDSRDEALQDMRILNEYGDLDPQGRPVKYAALALFDRASSQWPNPVIWTKSDDPAQALLIDRYLATPSRFSVGGPWMDLVGADADQQQTLALIQRASAETQDVAASFPSMFNQPAPNFFVWLLSLMPSGPVEGRPDSFVTGGPQSAQIGADSAAEAMQFLRDEVSAGRAFAAAMFDRTSPRWPNPVTWHKSPAPEHADAIAQYLAQDASSPSVGGPWMDLVGAQARQQADVTRRAEWPQTQALIQSAIDDATSFATTNPAEAYVWNLDAPSRSPYAGSSPGSIVMLEGTTNIVPFSTQAQALAYLRDLSLSNPVALAMFERSSPHWPNPTAWRKSSDPADAQVIAQHIARRAPTQMAQMSGTYMGADPAVSTAIMAVRQRAQQLAERRAGTVIGVIHTPKDRLWHTLAFGNEDDADDWLDFVTQNPEAYTYAAYFNKNPPPPPPDAPSSPRWPDPVIESISGMRSPPGTGLPRQSAAVIGQFLEGNRVSGKHLASTGTLDPRALPRRFANAAGALLAPDGWRVSGFRSLDDTIDWLQSQARDKSRFIYAAAYEKGPDGTAFIQDEEVGTARALPPVAGWAA